MALTAQPKHGFKKNEYEILILQSYTKQTKRTVHINVKTYLGLKNKVITGETNENQET